MPTNVYVNTGQTAGEQCSSGGEGRILTFAESVLTHPYHADGFVDGGDPVVYDNIVGVARSGAAAATDLIAIDTEGIRWLNVLGSVSDDSDDGVAETLSIGSPIYIKKTPGADTYILSGQSDPVSWQPFGYVLGEVTAHLTVPTLVAVKVHWDPTEDDTIQKGLSSAMWESDKAGHSFLSLRADASNVSGDHRLIYSALTISGAGASGESVRGRTIATAALAGGVHGVHGGVELGTGGSITGLSAGVRGTFMAPDAALAGTGQIFGGLSELYSSGASTDYSTAPLVAIHSFEMNGNATGADTALNVFNFGSLGTTTQFVAATNTVIDHALQVQVNGTTYWIGLYDATS